MNSIRPIKNATKNYPYQFDYFNKVNFINPNKNHLGCQIDV